MTAGGLFPVFRSAIAHPNSEPHLRAVQDLGFGVVHGVYAGRHRLP